MSRPTVPRSRGGSSGRGAAASDALAAGITTGLSPVDVTIPCHDGDPDLWFAENPADLERAKTLCADCPIRAECLAGALERGEPWGVWGGEIFERGAIVGRKRPRGRPRKADVAARQETQQAGGPAGTRTNDGAAA